MTNSEILFITEWIRDYLYAHGFSLFWANLINAIVVGAVGLVVIRILDRITRRLFNCSRRLATKLKLHLTTI